MFGIRITAHPITECEVPPSDLHTPHRESGRPLTLCTDSGHELGMGNSADNTADAITTDATRTGGSCTTRSQQSVYQLAYHLVALALR